MTRSFTCFDYDIDLSRVYMVTYHSFLIYIFSFCGNQGYNNDLSRDEGASKFSPAVVPLATNLGYYIYISRVILSLLWRTR